MSQNIGDIGYSFRKRFDEGWFVGEVVEIRLGAASGKDRRCVYEDGDCEDLSLAQLRALARRDPFLKDGPRSRSASPKPLRPSGKAIGSAGASDGTRKSGRELTPSVKLAGYQLQRSRKRAEDGDGDGRQPSPGSAEPEEGRGEPSIEPALPNISPSETGQEGGDASEEPPLRKSVRDRKPTRTYDEILIAQVHQKQAALKQRSARPSASAKIRDLLSSLDDADVPVDRAAEGTFPDREGDGAEREGDDDASDRHEEWLCRVASRLGAAAGGRKGLRPASRCSALSDPDQSRRSAGVASVCSAEFEGGGGEVPASVLVEHAPLPTEVGEGRRARMLHDVDRGSRHEYLVFDREDGDRVVGEVLVEGKKGWVEVCFGGAELVKCRSSQLIVLPRDKFKVGQQVPPDYIAAPLEEKNADQSAFLKCSPAEKKQSRNRKQAVSLDDIFYWQCRCDGFNKATEQICGSCSAKRTPEAKRSKLLEIAEDAVNTDHVNSTEDAIAQIPEAARHSIPDQILAKLLEAKVAGIHFSEFCVADSLDSMPLASCFYWICGTCTFQNNFKKGLCSACRGSKGYFARSSPLLEVAERVAATSKTARDAYSSWPAHETRQIPAPVLESLITCTFMVARNGTQRRCRNQKLDGLEFCKDHCDPSLLTALRAEAREEASAEASDSCSKESSTPSSSAQRRTSLIGISSMKEALQVFLSSKIGAVRNTLGWTNTSIEDQLICDSDSKPFPLGLKVRTYFLGYDCHDGRIIKVRRQFLDDGAQDARPVLMYRVVYNDGDQQDWMHHNICSLRQVFDIRNVDPEASFDEQIPPGTLYEMKTGVNVKVTRHTRVQKEQFVSFVVVDDNSGGCSAEIDLSLLKFQVGVVRKIAVGSKSDRERAMAGASLIEWPVSNGRVSLPNDAGSATQYKVCNGLHLLSKPTKVEHAIPHLNKLPNVDNPNYGRRGVKRPRWDPANVHNFIVWDPSQCLVCEICGQDKDDNQVVICDKCHSGFHSYCLRPVMVNIPKRDWVCAACSGRSNSLSFVEFSKNVAGEPHSVLEFLKLPYASYNEFIQVNSEALSLFAGRCSFNANKHKMVTRNLYTSGSILFVKSPDRNDWRLPSPMLTEEDYASSIESYVAAMKYCGMSNYSETCLYPQTGKTTEDMNNTALDQDDVHPLSKRNLEIFNAFKENLKRGIFPPVKVVHDEKYGFSVEALKAMPTQTLIAEYTGEVITLEQSSESDSLMILLDTGNPATSLLIDPTNSGNIARFLSGVNNMSLVSKRKANVRTRRFCLDGHMRVALFTSRRIEPGEKLNYDYNAGREGQSSEQWLKGGFYDTSNFF